MGRRYPSVRRETAIVVASMCMGGADRSVGGTCESIYSRGLDGFDGIAEA